MAKASRLKRSVFTVAKANRLITSAENYPKCDRCSNKEPVKVAKRKKTLESDLQKKKKKKKNELHEETFLVCVLYFTNQKQTTRRDVFSLNFIFYVKKIDIKKRRFNFSFKYYIIK